MAVVNLFDIDFGEFKVSRDDEEGEVKLRFEADKTTVTLNVGRTYDNAVALANTLEQAVKDLREKILKDWEDRPEDYDAYVSADRGQYYVSLEGVPHKGGPFLSRDIAEYELAAMMTATGCFPNSWYQNEYGGYENNEAAIREYHDEGGTDLKPLEGVEYSEGDELVVGDYEPGDGSWTVERDYGWKLGIVMHVTGDPSAAPRRVVTDRIGWHLTDNDDDKDDAIREVAHVGWMYPDGVHSRYELARTEPGRRDYSAPCPCGCDTPPTE